MFFVVLSISEYKDDMLEKNGNCEEKVENELYYGEYVEFMSKVLLDGTEVFVMLLEFAEPFVKLSMSLALKELFVKLKTKLAFDELFVALLLKARSTQVS